MLPSHTELILFLTTRTNTKLALFTATLLNRLPAIKKKKKINFYVKIMKLENEMKSQLTDFESFPRSFSSDSDGTFSSRLR